MDTSKIIKGAVSSGRYTVTAPIIKEDYGLYLQIEGVELPQTYEVDFSNSEHSGTSVTMIGNSDGVLIPHQFIDTGKDIFAFLYHVGANYGRTVYKFRIPNKVRPDRTDDTPTPEQASVIDQAISALNTAVEQTAQDVIDADASAQSASADAERAEEARTDAQNYATQAEQAMDDAQTYANNAQASATASAQSASQSAQIKADVEDLADDAQASANASAQSASQASASEQGCARAVLDAASAAAIARARADEASGYAQTASAKAQDASGYAQTASTKATEASQSASQALTYKNDAESAKTASQTAQGLAESARDTAVSAKTDAESARDDAVQAKEDAESAVASISGALAEKAPVITDTASGSIASFSDGADDLPLKSLIVDINPVQDLHGQDAPYPAGGGKNKVIYPYYSGSSAVINGVTFTVDSNGVITANGLASKNAEFILMQAAPVTLAAGDWTISGLPSGGGASSFVWNTYAHYQDDTIVFDRRIGAESYTFNCPNGLKDLYIGLRIISGYNCNNLKVYPQFESGSSATTFAPYSNICPISGWTGCEVNASGKNLLNPDISSWGLRGTAYRYINNVVPKGQTARLTFIDKDTSVSVSGINLGFVYNDLSSSLPSTYTWVLNNGALKSNVSNVAVNGNVGAKCQNVMIYPQSEEAFNAVFARYNVMVELGTTASDYEPYQGESIPISWQTEAGTVYGGKLDVLTGGLTVYPYYASYNGETLTGEWISDRDKYLSGTTPTIGAQVVNIGAQGVTVQLEPHEVESLHGVNNLWADSGDTEVEYRADTKLFIERLTAPDSADMIADANIQSGKYFMVGNSLYLATANIASGSAVIVGTNATRKSLSEALNEINA